MHTFCSSPSPLISSTISCHRTKEQVCAENRRRENSRSERRKPYLVLSEMETRELDGRVRRSCFYTAPTLPQAHRHCTRTVIFQQTHHQSKISSLTPQVVLLFLSTLSFHFLISDIPALPCMILSCATRRRYAMKSHGSECRSTGGVLCRQMLAWGSEVLFVIAVGELQVKDCLEHSTHASRG